MQELGLSAATAALWFQTQQRASYVFVTVAEPVAQTLPVALADAFRRCYVTDAALAQAATQSQVTQSAALAAKTPDRGSIMAGDFGEIFTYVYQAALALPATAFGPKKWRLKQDRTKPAPKSDVVQFILPNWPTPSADDVLMCSEAKIKSTRGGENQIANAIKGCTTDRTSRLASTLVWFQERSLYESLGTTERAHIDRFVHTTDHPGFAKKFYAVAIVSRELVNAEIQAVPATPSQDFTLLVVDFPQLKHYYEAVFQAMSNSVVPTPPGINA